MCQGESAAGSNTDDSILIRDTIRSDLIRGESKQQILTALEARYGNSILESPPKSGLTLLAWWLPVAITALVVIGLALGFRHWRRKRLAGSTRHDPSTPGGTGTASAADEALVRDALARYPDRGARRR